VGSAAVIGLPDGDLGARAHAILELAPGAAAPEAAALKAFLAERLTPYKIPYTYEITPDPLRDEAGKVRRLKLREARLERPVSGFPKLR
jgi:bile acid-coenzyme A ligase